MPESQEPESQEPEGRKVTVSFRKSPDYRIFSATDVYGGPTADGSGVFFHLTIDHFPTPSYQTFNVNDHGQVNLGTARETITAGDLEKELLCGIMFTPDVAIKIGNWLVQHGTKLKGL